MTQKWAVGVDFHVPTDTNTPFVVNFSFHKLHSSGFFEEAHHKQHHDT